MYSLLKARFVLDPDKLNFCPKFLTQSQAQVRDIAANIQKPFYFIQQVSFKALSASLRQYPPAAK